MGTNVLVTICSRIAKEKKKKVLTEFNLTYASGKYKYKEHVYAVVLKHF